jgi:ligand-binding sensor domain-containing protein
MRQVAILLCLLVSSCGCGFALNPALDISQYAHTAWTVRDGFAVGNIYAMAQTPDGYLWLGTEFGLFRFDGLRAISWRPPAGQELPDKNINSLLVSRDGTLWIGTFAGLATWSGGKLIRRPLPGGQFVASLFQDREGTVWASTLASPGVLCAIRSGAMQCYGGDGAFGRAVWALYEDSSGTLWAAAQTGLWRMRPDPLRRYVTPTELIALNKFDDGRLLIAMHDRGLMQLAGDKVESYAVRDPIHPNRVLRDRDVDSNRVLRDRDGGLWIGTVERGLIHLHRGRTDVFRKSDGLSGDVVLSVFEDREGDIWVASTGGIDRFRELPVTTLSVKQGLSSDATQSVLAAKDGSIWVGAHEGLSRWKDGQVTVFGKASGLPDNAPESLFQDDRGRIWVSTRHRIAYFQNGRFAALNAAPGGEVHYITGDSSGNLWLSEHRSLWHLLEGRLVEQIPWSELGREQSAELLLWDRERGGLWLGFWHGGLAYFKDGQFRASYTAADGLGEGGVVDLQFDRDGALWAATQKGGLSRIRNGRITTLTMRNGLPCNAVHWTIEDDDRSFWVYTACGLVRIRRTEIDAWISDPKRRIETTVWDAADGVRLRSSAASAYGPRVTKSTDGKLWYVTGEGV